MTSKNAERVRKYRQKTGYAYERIYKRANLKAATWVRENFPEVWERILREAKEADKAGGR